MKKLCHSATFHFGKSAQKLLRIMKLSTLILFLSVLYVSAGEVRSQGARVDLTLSGKSIADVLTTIEQQTSYLFFYNKKEINVDKQISLSVTNAPVSEVLADIFSGTDVNYSMVKDYIVLSKKEIKDELATKQQQKVTGTVTDATNGEPVVGANVIIEGTTIGVITDINGKFSIDVPNAEAQLLVSFLGFNSERIVVNGQTNLVINLVPDITKLDEVVVIGYGTAKKSDVTGSLTRVSEKTIKERPVQNAIQAFQGRVAGVDIGTNIRPGEVASINIRGTRSINGSNSPLFVVDGIILMGSINDVNPNDIANIEILKDASATAIYGSRGANGVVLVTTKSGKKGSVSVNYEASLTLDKIHSLTDWASSGEAIDRYRLAEINGTTYKSGANSLSYPDPFADIQMFGNSDPKTISAIRQGYEWNDPDNFTSVKTRSSTEEELAKGWPAEVPVYNSGKIPTTDWIDLLTKTSKTQNHLLSLSAGNDNSKLYLSLGYLNNDGTQKNQSYNRYTLKLNGDITPVKWLTAGTSINASRTQQEFGTINRAGSATGPKDAYGTALSQYLMAQPYDDNGVMIEFPGNNTTLPVWNPLIDIDNSKDERRAANVNANFYSELRIMPWLKYRMNLGTGFRYYRDAAWQGSQSTLQRKATPQTSAASYSSGEVFQYMIENLLFFDKTFGNHTFGATLLQSAQYYRSESSNIGASKILYNSSDWYNLGANLNGKPDSYGTGFGESSLQSYMGRLNYSLLNRYLFTATGRWDGSSVLATDHKWDFFPSFAAAWKMQEESFLKPVSWVNELKLRVGYGITGNSAIGSYTTMGPLTQYNYVFGTAPAIGYIPMSMANPYLGWEKTAQVNYGVDFSVLKNRISGSIEYYQSNTSDILMQRDIPVITGYPNIWFNIGKMKNSGIELTLSTVNVDVKGFRWTTDFNFTKNKEEIVELVNGKEDMKAQNWFIGQPLQVFRSYEVDGLWQDTPEDQAEIALWAANGTFFAPGQYKPVEQDSVDHKLQDNDMVIRGTNRPKWIAGFNNTFSYKNLELSCFIYARIGQSYFSSLQPGGSGGGKFVGYVRSADPDDFWSPTNTDARWPQPTTMPKTSDTKVNQAMYINDGSFVAIRNIGLSYSIPQKWLSKVNAKNFQVYAQVHNPFLFGGDVVKAGINPDDTNGWTSTNSVGDPVGGINNNTVLIRSWVFGVRLGF